MVSAARAPLRAHIQVTKTAQAKFPLEHYVAAADSEHGSIAAGTLVVPIHPSLIGDQNLKRGLGEKTLAGGLLIDSCAEHYKIALINGIHNLLPAHLPGIPTRALAYSPNITLSFVLLNEDATAGSFVDGWDVEGAIRGG